MGSVLATGTSGLRLRKQSRVKSSFRRVKARWQKADKLVVGVVSVFVVMWGGLGVAVAVAPDNSIQSPPSHILSVSAKPVVVGQTGNEYVQVSLRNTSRKSEAITATVYDSSATAPIASNSPENGEEFNTVQNFGTLNPGALVYKEVEVPRGDKGNVTIQVNGKRFDELNW